jgi:hypothetical protein
LNACFGLKILFYLIPCSKALNDESKIQIKTNNFRASKDSPLHVMIKRLFNKSVSATDVMLYVISDENMTLNSEYGRNW